MASSSGPRRCSWAPAGLIVLAAAGCGTAADQQQVRTAAERFSTATRQHDGTTACAQLSPAIRKQLISDESEPTCERAVVKLPVAGGRVATVRVYATSAEAELTGGETLFLGDTKLGWRIEAIGCKPHGPGPYDCEAQA